MNGDEWQISMQAKKEVEVLWHELKAREALEDFLQGIAMELENPPPEFEKALSHYSAQSALGEILSLIIQTLSQNDSRLKELRQESSQLEKRLN